MTNHVNKSRQVTVTTRSTTIEVTPCWLYSVRFTSDARCLLLLCQEKHVPCSEWLLLPIRKAFQDPRVGQERCAGQPTTRCTNSNTHVSLYTANGRVCHVSATSAYTRRTLPEKAVVTSVVALVPPHPHKNGAVVQQLVMLSGFLTTDSVRCEDGAGCCCGRN